MRKALGSGLSQVQWRGEHSKRGKGQQVDLEKDQRMTIGFSAGEVVPTDKG